MPKVKGSIVINFDKCKGCELCIVECPQECMGLSKKLNPSGYHYAILLEDTCTGCTNCALICPEAIIAVYRESKSKKQLSAIDTIAVNEHIPL
ncbi:MAG: ferredoxin family protein [Candidatus Marinimicrobia bacterium]|jgi:2-oxoglutarate ferredoxin oxidoreductase subunit delta|nr:ferredoxin family protein [Candidatus Neomarinimicrobiota bacterium]MBT3618757.1 ferredoxin family protein [Candidatus Neomarinimicrobiota bacterium]MBT3828324.1 ferredoxin family protein [Candidatus Neomarinimicrobiota bacterium]MBT3997215.1 ferredoxin family protein [Candidatus Neomarinimicrobiota bacterium]MBT4280187.1 ferredoxin family protein [Candidatus Neomarinimicrobiota bacterium]